MAAYPTLWFWRSDPLVGEWRAVESYSTDDHPHPYRVDGGERPSDTPAWSTLHHDGKFLRTTVDHGHLPKAPPLWFVLVDAVEPLGPTSSLLAFANDTHPDGAVLTVEQFRKTGISGDQQVGAIKWWRETATLVQIHVADTHRRRGIAIKLINTADVLIVGRSDVFLNGGDHLTDDGAALASQWGHSARLRQRVGYYPPAD